MSSGTSEHERAICRTALAWLAAASGFKLLDIQWAKPTDSARKNVEAEVLATTGPVLIEHTMVEPYHQQRTMDARFDRLAAALEGASWSDVPAPINLWFDLDYDTGIANAGQARRLADGMLRQLGTIAGSMRPGESRVVTVEGISAWVSRLTMYAQRPVSVGRTLPRDRDFDEELSSIVRLRLVSKRGKFVGRAGASTLVLEIQGLHWTANQVAEAALKNQPELAAFTNVLVIEADREGREPWFLLSVKVGDAMLGEGRGLEWEQRPVAAIRHDAQLLEPGTF